MNQIISTLLMHIATSHLTAYKQTYQWRWRRECRPSLSVISAAFIALGRSCLFANTSNTASLSSSWSDYNVKFQQWDEWSCLTVTMKFNLKHCMFGIQHQNEPRSAFYGAHLGLQPHDLYHYCPPQIWDLVYSGSNASREAESAQKQDKASIKKTIL